MPAERLASCKAASPASWSCRWSGRAKPSSCRSPPSAISSSIPTRARERAYRAEQAGWESIRTTVAACLNGVKGTALTLARRRGWPSVLDWAIDDNRIDRPTLDALLGAIDEALPMFRRYLKAKAKKLGLEQLRWWDLFAPVAQSARRFEWSQAHGFIVEKFSSFSGEMGRMAQASFEHRWIDAEPRKGKRGGAFCMSVEGVEESRVLANYDGSFDQVSTLAHELGHAYHNHCQRGLASLLRGADRRWPKRPASFAKP